VSLATRRTAPFAAAFFAAVAAAQDPAADLLAKLTLEEKAGQLFMSWSLSRAEQKLGASNHDRMVGWVRDAGLGGVILSLGTVDDAAAIVPKLQAAAKVPLLLAGDFEGGVWFRLRGATELGNQMLVGATDSPALAEAMGRITGEEAQALGFHWAFAPVLDVNSNPSNPIINVRSLGEDPQRVAVLGGALARGIRKAGVIPCGKHFPGHGDVDTDSHLALATVPGDGARLRAVELFPFAAAAKDGLEAVMTGHLGVPGLGEDPSVPATLSRRILTDVLRGELGFQGLVVTDALEMGGVKDAFPPGEVAVRALLAGADVLLMPPDPFAARAAVVEAVQQGRVPQARLDDAVLRILRAKQKVGLLGGGGKVAADWRQRLRTPANEAVADQIAARGLTLVRDRDGALPLPASLGDGDLVVTLVDKDEGQGGVFAASLGADAARTVRLAGDADAAAVAAACARIAASKRVVLGLHVKVREYQGGVGLPPALRPVLEALRPEQVVAAVSFGNPYLVRNLPHADAYLAAFVDTERVERAAAAALRGQAAITGRLPVGIPDVAAGGSGLTRLPGRDLPRTSPALADMDPALPDRLFSLLYRAVNDKAFPGAVCVVVRRGAVVAEVAVGAHDFAEGAAAVTPDTRYDLASLTKVCATLPAVLKLVAAGKLSLDDPVQKHVPAFVGIGKDKVTVRHLLAHQAGLPAYERYYKTTQGKAAIVAAACAEPLMGEPGASVVYSDLGFVLLMAVVEACSGEDFAAFAQREVFAPLGMASASFQPTAGAAALAPPTEDDPARGGVVRGFVHDENAFAMGGVSGHAGLFANALDVARLGVALLAGGREWLPRDVAALATKPSGIGDDRTRALGMQLLADGGYGGTKVPEGTFGHTGFTGTSLWCDPRHDLCVVLLTNRVHPTRVNNKIHAVRRAVHDAALQCVR
jgi:beta-N-acetylhexosaminidase